MEPEVDLLPNHEGMCLSIHNDLIYTPASGHNDQFPAASYYRETTKPLKATLMTRVHPQEVWINKSVKVLQELCCHVSNVSHTNALI